MRKYIFGFVLLLIIVGISVLIWKKMHPPEREIWCAGQVELCPDGSRAWRYPPDCELEPCPTN